jgi:hypothetical protein
MPAFENLPSFEGERVQETPIIFPPVSKEHILHCSYDYWFPKYAFTAPATKTVYSEANVPPGIAHLVSGPG